MVRVRERHRHRPDDLDVRQADAPAAGPRGVRQRRAVREPMVELNARYRRTVRARGHFPTEQAALKCLYLVTRSLDPTEAGRARWTMRWNP